MIHKTALCAAFACALLAACGGTDQPSTSAPNPEASSQSTLEETTPAQTSTQADPNLLAEVASAAYKIETGHASLIWKVSHNGLSNYTARFTDFSADLTFDAASPANSTLTATINPLSVRTDHPAGPDWDTTLGTDEKFFNATAFPQITYTSTGVTRTGPDTGIITGELSLLGITKQVPLDVTFNGARNFAWFGTRDVIGFSATAKLKRSDFGMSALLPSIGDEISITIETEFLQTE